MRPQDKKPGDNFIGGSIRDMSHVDTSMGHDQHGFVGIDMLTRQ